MDEKELDRKAEIFVDNYLKKYSDLIHVVSLRQLFKEMYKCGAKDLEINRGS